MTKDENRLNRHLDYKEADRLRKPAIAATALQVTYVGEGGTIKHATIPKGTPVWYLMSVEWPYLKEGKVAHKPYVLICNTLTEGHAVTVKPNQVELYQDYLSKVGPVPLTAVERYLDYTKEYMRLGQIVESIKELEGYDPCQHCKPDSVTGNCPCDNGYPCEHMWVPGKGK